MSSWRVPAGRECIRNLMIRKSQWLRAATVLGICVLACCRSASPSHLDAAGALGPYSAAAAAGDLVFLAGKISPQRDSFEAEVHGAIDAVDIDLNRLGLGLDDVISVTVYLTDMSDYAALNAIYAQRFPKPYPARTCIAVAALPAGARVELQAVARR